MTVGMKNRIKMLTIRDFGHLNGKMHVARVQL